MPDVLIPLSELHAYVVRPSSDPRGTQPTGGSGEIDGAYGIAHFCPSCWAAGMPLHGVTRYFAGAGVPDDRTPLHRWHPSGTTLGDLTTEYAGDGEPNPADKGEHYDWKTWTGRIENGCAVVKGETS